VTGKAAEDVVLFVGAGATAAANKLVQLLGLHLPPPPPTPAGDASSAFAAAAHLAAAPVRRPVVLVGPMEHHSNLLPWRESFAEVVGVGSGPDGRVDLAQLEQCLRAARGAPLVCGSFSAASNVTGVVERVDAVTALLHQHGALSFWDYATLAPYAAVDMNPAGGAHLRKDAVFFSPHKLVGGANTPGVLVVKKRLLANEVPGGQPGGGTVFYVTADSHRLSGHACACAHARKTPSPASAALLHYFLLLSLKRAARLPSTLNP
jgi:selenocysteine lyase/cysteine desulfurase